MPMCVRYMYDMRMYVLCSGVVVLWCIYKLYGKIVMSEVVRGWGAAGFWGRSGMEEIESNGMEWNE